MRLQYVAMTALVVLTTGAASSPSYAQQPADPSTLRVCTGSKTGNYYFAGKEWLERISHDLFQRAENVSPPQPGSLTNLRKLASGDCDVGFAQADVVNQYIVENPASRDTISLLKVAYKEYVHILCPTTLKASTLTDFAKLPGTRTLIVGEDGSGTAETWRILRQTNDKLYGSILRDNQPADITSATAVMDSAATCMMWVSGLNSGDMVSANQRSVQTQSGKPGLKLISIDDPAFLKLMAINGQPLYQSETVTPRKPTANQPGLYNNLINNGGWFNSDSITMLSVPSDLMIRNDYKTAIGREKLSRISTSFIDALPTIWARVNPDGKND